VVLPLVRPDLPVPALEVGASPFCPEALGDDLEAPWTACPSMLAAGDSAGWDFGRALLLSKVGGSRVRTRIVKSRARIICHVHLESKSHSIPL
jgi:hypothetical protein